LRNVTLASVCLGDSGAIVLCLQLAQHLALRKLSIQECGVVAGEVAALQALVPCVEVELVAD